MKYALIGSAGRSGSTILGMYLGSLPGVFYAGELAQLWGTGHTKRDPRLGLPMDRKCGCGDFIADCPFWGDVAKRVEQSVDVPEGSTLGSYALEISEMSLLWARRNKSRWEHLTLALLDAVADVADCEVVADSSKGIWDLVMARFVARDSGSLLKERLNLVHLVRDPRAVAYSWSQRSYDSDPYAWLPRHSVRQSHLRWMTANVILDRLDRELPSSRSQSIRYEDFAANPGAAVEGLLETLGLVAVNAQSSFSVQGVQHTVAGNPVRFSQNNKITPDEKWRGDGAGTKPMPRLVARVARRYGYSNN